MNVNTRRQVGLERQRHQVEHRVGVLFPRIGNAHRRPRRDRDRVVVCFSARWMRPSISRTMLEILIEPHVVARAEPALERRDVALHRVEDAAVLPHARHALARREPGRPNMRSNTTRGLVSMRHRRRRRLPRRWCSCRRSCSRRRTRRRSRSGPRCAISSDGNTVSRPIWSAMIWSSEVPAMKSSASVRLGAAPVSQVPRADGVRAGRRPIEIGDHVTAIAERLERLQDRTELEARSGRGRRPVAGPLAHRHEHRAEASRRRGRGRGLSASAPAPSHRAAAAPAWRPGRAEPSDAAATV